MHLNAFLMSAMVGICAALGRQLKDRHDTSMALSETKRYIVEFAREADSDIVKSEIESRNGNKIVKAFDGRIFRGISIETSSENIDSLRMMRNVTNVWRSKSISLGPTLDRQDHDDDVGASNYSIHHMTGVDRLHGEGILGAGVVIAVIDTGVQYTHPALGGGLGAGFKVTGGHDFVGDKWYPRGPFDKEPDDDPYDTDGHGTHVAGIIAGSTDQYCSRYYEISMEANSTSWRGVAPNATLRSYKVFGGNGGTDEETLIEAFIMAHQEGADIISASIGGPGGWSSNAWSVVASRIVESGTLVTISAGNSGELGPFFGSSGSSGELVLAVASVEADTWPAVPFEASFIQPQPNLTNTSTFAYLPDYDYFPSSIHNLPIFALSLNASDVLVGCNPLPASTGNLSDSVVLLPLLPTNLQTNCSSLTKQKNVVGFGARHILFFNPEGASLQQTGTGSDTVNVGIIDYETGAFFLETLSKGSHLVLDFSAKPGVNYVGIRNAGGGIASYFTSQAALYDLQIKPDVAAPGGNIFSSYLNNGYTVLSGTSMACPYVAGVAALYISQHGGKAVHGDRFAKSLAMRIMSSGRALRWNDGQSDKDYGFWAPVSQVGTGIIDAYRIVHYDTSLSWSKFALNDTANHKRHQKVAITNNGSRPVRYRFKVQDAGGHEVMDSGDPPLVQWGPSPNGDIVFLPFKIHPEVGLPPDEFWVNPGSTKNAEFSFDSPAGLEEDRLPVYSGKIIISGTNAEELSVPYMGVAGNIQSTFTNVFYPNYPRSISTTNDTPIEEKPIYTFDLSLEAQDFPRITCGFRWGVQHLRWDIFEAGWGESDWTYPPVVGKHGYVGAATSWAGADYNFVFNASQDDELDLVSFPVFDLARDIPYEYWWFGRLVDGNMIGPGNYTIRFAALTPFGSPENAADWDVFQAPEIQVLETVEPGEPGADHLHKAKITRGV